MSFLNGRDETDASIVREASMLKLASRVSLNVLHALQIKRLPLTCLNNTIVFKQHENCLFTGRFNPKLELTPWIRVSLGYPKSNAASKAVSSHHHTKTRILHLVGVDKLPLTGQQSARQGLPHEKAK